MRKIYFLLVLVGLSASAQIVNIPDANFKNKLLVIGVDTNNDNEIQESEASAVTFMDVTGSNISSLEGISAFTGLTQLICQGNNLTTLDVGGLMNMELLLCSGNDLVTLDISNTNIKELYCESNALTSLTLSDSIRDLFCAGNQLSTLDLNHDFGYCWISNNPLVGDYIISASNLVKVSNTDISSAIVSNPTGSIIPDIEFSNNPQLVSLDLSGVHNLNGDTKIQNNPLLQYLNLKNGCPETASGGWAQLYLSLLPSLEFICGDDFDLANIMSLPIGSNPVISSYCGFTPGGDYNTVTGTVRLDASGNGCDADDAVVPQLAVKINSGAVERGKTFTNMQGGYTSYSVFSNPGGYNTILTPLFENLYYSATPATYTTSFIGYGNSATADFCIAPNGVHPDLEITLIPITVARPGFDATYKINYRNKGTETQSGTVSLAFEDDILDFVSANPTTDSQAANTLSWNFSNLAPFESREITLTLNVNSPLETPAVNIGDVLDFTAAVSAGTDETPADNTFEFDHVVVGSFDPNDKAVSRESIGIAQLGDYLYYTVRFQNTGNFYAENVVVKDMLSANLDLTTLQMVSASHPYRATLTNTNKLEFFFEGINLPAVGDDEPGSHGYVTFKIKPKSNLVVGNTIANDASIYFDFNAPIVTNTVTTTVTALGNPEVAANDFVVYPNPAKHTISIQAHTSIESVAIYNTLGQLVKTANRQTTIDISGLSPGSYFLQLVSSKGKTTKKMIKI
ncbi:hypothetical protein FLLO111716_01380 [Flavobacterium longum]|uniref:DUF7619 domain-containing protein n=1 Tax=Flavobacterium longum TaxID=1299340 RepID=UPI0039E8E782